MWRKPTAKSNAVGLAGAQVSRTGFYPNSSRTGANQDLIAESVALQEDQGGKAFKSHENSREYVVDEQFEINETANEEGLETEEKSAGRFVSIEE